jgi:hypothetical protein
MGMTTLGFSMELGSGALTRLEGMPVVAACRHAGSTVVSGGAGLFRVGGDTDDGAPIAVRVILPATDCGEEGPMRLTGVGLSGVVSGRVAVAATSDAGASLEGTVGLAGDGGLPGFGLARLGRGYGRTWRVALSAGDGADLDVGEIALFPLPLDRRPA